MNILTISSENPIIHSCQVATALDYSLNAAQNLVSLDDTPRRSAASVRAIIAVARRKHRHAAQCSQCLINEALASAVRRKPAGSLFVQEMTAAQKAMAHA
jgi:hypothetical protein